MEINKIVEKISRPQYNIILKNECNVLYKYVYAIYLYYKNNSWDVEKIGNMTLSDMLTYHKNKAHYNVKHKIIADVICDVICIIKDSNSMKEYLLN